MKIENVYIYEDNKVENLHPLTYLRPVYDLKCGIFSLREKIEKHIKPAKIKLICREYLKNYVSEQNPDIQVNKITHEDCLFINGRIIADKNLLKSLSSEEGEIIFLQGDEIAAVKMKAESMHKLDLKGLFSTFDFTNFKKKNISVKLINYPWNLVFNNGKQIIADTELVTVPPVSFTPNKFESQPFNLINPENIFLDEHISVKPGVVLDAEEGPIYIGKNVKILPNAVIQGPAYIGNNSIIKMHAKIYKNTSIGETCKIGGEVEESIFHSYSNKQHEGFIGHSYIASWVNLGADTNNSDLKNNYGNIKTYLNGKLIDTGLQFVGLTMGDHSKTAINTMLNTGTVVGISCNIFGSGFPPVYIPSFSWGGSDSMKIYGLDKSIEVAEIVMSRRNKIMTEAEREMFRFIFDLTGSEREHRIRKIN